MNKLILVAALGAVVAMAGCTSNPQTNRDLQCAGGIVGGGIVGGILGNQVGKGTGKRVATTVGAGAGAAIGTQNPACKPQPY